MSTAAFAITLSFGSTADAAALFTALGEALRSVSSTATAAVSALVAPTPAPAPVLVAPTPAPAPVLVAEPVPAHAPSPTVAAERKPRKPRAAADAPSDAEADGAPVAVVAIQAPAAPAAPAAHVASAPHTITLAQLRSRFAMLLQQDETAGVPILAKYCPPGAKRTSEIPVEKYPEVMAEIDAQLSARGIVTV